MNHSNSNSIYNVRTTIRCAASHSIALTPRNFWGYVKSDDDSDEVLHALGDHNDLRASFLFFHSLNRTIEDLERLKQKTRREMNHLFHEMTEISDFQRLTDPFVRRKY